MVIGSSALFQDMEDRLNLPRGKPTPPSMMVSLERLFRFQTAE